MTDAATAYATGVVDGDIIAGPHVRAACQRHLRDLVEGPDRGLEWRLDRADYAIQYFRQVLRLNGGEFEGAPFELLGWQAFIVGSLFGWHGPDGYRRFRVAFVETGKGPLALDTPIPTPTGWTTMGEIQVGDRVFDEAGRPCNVTAVSPVFHERDCYRLVFDDGHEIVADAEHRWFTEMRRSPSWFAGDGYGHKGVPKSEWGGWRHGVRTTTEIRDTLRYTNGKYQSANHSIPLAGALDVADAILPVDPYVLGVWLGDGDSDCARVTVADVDVETVRHLEACGAAVGGRHGSGERAGRYTLLGMAPALRDMGLLHNKRVPREYMRGSARQRQALLQGLMDTDGYIADRGNCEFTTTRKELGVQVRELVQSLGMKCTINEGRATIDGRDVGPKWRVLFHPGDVPVFRLQRKLDRQGVGHTRRRLSSDRRIVDCVPVASVPVRCITVDARSHLFLAGRGMIPTHNSGKSPLSAGIGLLMQTADNEPRAEVYAAATKRDQAMILFRDAVAMVDQSDALRSRIKKSGRNPVYNLLFKENGSFFRPIASDDAQSGPRPHCALLDEVHEHKNATMVEMMRAGTKGRRQALIFMITNSGFDRTSVCYDRHEYGAKVAAGELEDDTFFSYICAVDDKDDPINDPVDPELGYPRSWAKANPSLGHTFPVKYLEEQVREARGMPAKESIVRRLNFCQWVDAESPWISGKAWRSCEVERIPWDVRERPAFLGLDLSGKRDLTALAVVWPDDEGGFDAEVHFWSPGDTLVYRSKKDRVPYDVWESDGHLNAPPGKSLDYEYIAAEVVKLWEAGVIVSLAFDPYRIEDFQRELDDLGVESWIYEGPDKRPGDGIKLVRHGQGFGGGASAATLWMPRSITALEDAILEGRLRVKANPVLRWNASAAVTMSDPQENRKWEKRKSTGRIDGIVALSMAIGAAAAPREEVSEPTIFAVG